MSTSTIAGLVGSVGAVLVLMTTSLETRAPSSQTAPPSAPAAPQTTGFGIPIEQVQIKTTKISSNFYTLEGRNNSGVLVGPDGVFLVDSQEAELAEKLEAAIKQISDGRIRFLVNTHVHLDHTGGNGHFGRMGVVLMAREELRARLAQHNLSAGGVPEWRPPAPVVALAMVAYRGLTTVRMNGDEVRLIPVRFAHTDGDTLVHFMVADVLMMGDVFRMSGFPNIDRNNGGTVKGTIAALGTAIDAIGPNTKVVPGHGVVADRAMLFATRDMMIAVRDRVAQLVRQGKTPEQVVAAKPTSDYDAYVPGGTASNADRFVRQIYAELVGESTN